ncbi:MAG TPA: HD domain-containing phosphohydrolase [Candidatus Dormibacteraeota bacterium]
MDTWSPSALPGGVTSLLRSIVNSLPVVVFAFDARGEILLAEGSALRLLRSSPGASVGESIFDAFAGEPETIEHIRRALEGREHVAEIVLDRNGRPYRVWYTPWLDASGQVSVVTGLALDITAEVRGQRRAAGALHDRQWEEEQRRLQLWNTLDATIGALAAAVEYRDPYTAGHQRRVAELSRALALELGLGIEETQGIYIAASIHDIGKIAVPAELLTRPGPLTPAELELVKQHAQIGADIIAAVPFPWPVRDMILQHHERLNGSGYPNGLSGEEVLMGARIIGVADVVEAFSSRRPYRAARGLAEALNYIQASHALFDRDVVSCCVALFKQRRFRFTRIPASRQASA